MAADKARGLTIQVDVDVSEAITGLKAVQREAKEATKALRELESAQKILERIERIESDPNSAIPWKEVRKNTVISED